MRLKQSKSHNKWTLSTKVTTLSPIPKQLIDQGVISKENWVRSTSFNGYLEQPDKELIKYL